MMKRYVAFFFYALSYSVGTLYRRCAGSHYINAHYSFDRSLSEGAVSSGRSCIQGLAPRERVSNLPATIQGAVL
jgi:hypothetical protein